MHAEHTQEAVSAQSDTSQGGLPRVASVPLRARWRMLRQRIILTVRWWFRLLIDDIREQQLDALADIVQQQVEAINTMVRVMNGLSARLALYEREIPRMRELRRGFDLEQSGLRAQKANGHAREDGILTLPENRIIRP